MIDYGFHSVSTVQKRKVKGLEFPSSDKTFLKSPRGSFESMVNEKKSLTVVRWNDNKPVCLLASFVGAGEPEFCLRFDKKKMVRIQVACPLIVKEYNKFMGGVDLCDMFMALYRIDRRSKKYYHRIIYYLISVCCCNAWIIHKINQKFLGKKVLSLLDFIVSVSLSLMRTGKPVKPISKFNRYSTATAEPESETVRRSNYKKRVVPKDLKYDS